MKKYLSLAALAIAFVGCTSDEFVGKMPQAPEANGPMAINFGGTNASITRAANTYIGSEAADMLGKQFRVYGTSTASDNSTSVVFDNYVVNYNGKAGDPEDSTNTNGWTYLNQMSLGSPRAQQNLKYWDMSAAEYDFIAFAGLADDMRITTTTANRFAVDQNNMDQIFVSDRVTSKRAATNTGSTANHQYMPESNYKNNEPNPVVLNFKHLVARLRVGIYETVPGYAVKDVKFYYGDNYKQQAGTSTKTDLGLDGSFPTEGEAIITYDENNIVKADFEGDTIRYKTFGDLVYTTAASTIEGGGFLKEDGSADATGDKKFLSTTSALPTWAQKDGATDSWQTVLPFASSNKNLVLRVDFTLVPLDGNPAMKNIEVKGASAVVPKTFAQWKPNYAYTYIFKISDKTNGTTGPADPNPDDPDNPNPNPSPSAPDGLYPITFDATVSSYEDYNQETITGITSLGGDAITTYSKDSDVTNNGEYKVGETITAVSYSFGQWSVVYSATEPTEQQVADNNTYNFEVIAGKTEEGQTINQAAVHEASFKAEQAGWYIIKLRYLPIGLVDIDENYVNVFKVVKVVE